MSASFDWSQFSTEKPSTPTQGTQTTGDKFDWSNFPQYEGNPPSTAQTIGRNIARTGVRVAETLGGRYGDILNAPGNLLNYIVEKATGKEQPELKSAIKFSRNLLTKNVPTSQEIREQTKKISGDFLEPQSKVEAKSDEIVSDIAALTSGKGFAPFVKGLGIALGGNLASEGAELLGAGEEGKSITKAGSTFLLSLINPKGAQKYAKDLYSSARKALPEEASVSANNLRKSINSLESELEKGGSAAYKNPSLVKLREIRSKIRHNEIPIDELTQFKVDLNQARDSLYGNVDLNKNGRALAKRNLDATSKIVDEALTEYGKINPEWLKFYRAGNEVHGAIANSQKISNAIGRFIKQHPHTSAALLATKLFFGPKAFLAGASGYGFLKGAELGARFFKSPILQKYYLGAVQGALKDDAVMISKNLNKLGAAVSKEENKD